MQLRNESNGRYAKDRFVPKLLFVMFSIVLAIVAIGEVMNRQLDYQAPFVSEALAAPDKLEVKTEELKKDFLERLSVGCETRGVADPDGAIIFDSNNQPSIGRFQFQRKTVIHYVKLLENRDITNAEAVKISVDKDKATELASRIIFGLGELESNWTNCARKLGLQSELNIIKKLME